MIFKNVNIFDVFQSTAIVVLFSGPKYLFFDREGRSGCTSCVYKSAPALESAASPSSSGSLY